MDASLTANPGRSVCVLGAGPAGMSCALWLKNLGLQPLVLEQQVRPGGMQNFNFLVNDSVLGYPDQTGPMLAQQFAHHLAVRHIELLTNVQSLSVTRDQRGGLLFKGVLPRTGWQSWQCDALVIATGTRYRAAEVIERVPGVCCVDNQDICYGPYAFSEQSISTHLKVLIIGGGDNAIENAKILSAAGAQVYVAARAEFRAQRGLFESVEANPRCTLYPNAHLQKIALQNGEYVVDLGMQNGQTRQLVINRIHILAGYEPNSSCLQSILSAQLWQALSFDSQAYLLTDDDRRTGCQSIYAAGDICNPRFPSVVSAIAQGAQAARTIEMDLRQCGSE